VEAVPDYGWKELAAAGGAHCIRRARSKKGKRNARARSEDKREGFKRKFPLKKTSGPAVKKRSCSEKAGAAPVIHVARREGFSHPGVQTNKDNQMRNEVRFNKKIRGFWEERIYQRKKPGPKPVSKNKLISKWRRTREGSTTPRGEGI